MSEEVKQFLRESKGMELDDPEKLISIMEKEISQELQKRDEQILEAIRSYEGDLTLERTTCSERIRDYLSGQITSCEEITKLITTLTTK